MKSSFLRSIAAFVIVVSLLTSPILAIQKKGDKNYKQGLKHEVAERWDKAAEEFALAVAANPGNAEFRLHYIRALFNASQMMMQRGRTLAEQKDYVGAYNAFRQAYGYDPVNELAKSEMERMLRLQEGLPPKGEPQNQLPKDGTNTPPPSPPDVKVVPTSYTASGAPAVPMQDPVQVEQLRDIRYTKVDLKTVVKDLAQTLDLNILFDTQSFNRPRDITIELKNVTTAQALDAIFLQEGLFFQKVGRRMILVADQNRRQNFQQLVLRTFYLANANPEEVRNVLSQAIPPQPGRPPTQAIIDKATNSLTVRDTAENIKLIGNLIKALDKDRAEVVMDVNIYEVSKTDFFKLGLQLGDANSLSNLGGTTPGVVGVGGNGNLLGRGTTGAAAAVFNKAIGAGILLPTATLSALQSKGNARLLASTQVHAFNNEESQARIGQRVPVRTAQFLGYGNTGTGTPTNNNGFGNAASVYNYEQVGLTLKFTPIVFPNQDVQVKMSIESKDVAAAGIDENPTFTERTITGTARIQNNRTLLMASVAQDSQTNSRTGVPLLSAIPVLGRLFSAPSNDRREVDIVIAVTPRVLRAPNILPEDEAERETGSTAVPTNSSLATMLQREEQEEQLAAARRLTNTAVIQMPDAKPEAAAPSYVQANTALPGAQTTPVSNQTNNFPVVTPRPIDTSVKTLNITPTSEKTDEGTKPNVSPELPNQSSSVVMPPSANVKVESPGILKAGQKRRVAVRVTSPLALRMAVLSLEFDTSKIAVRNVLYGDVFGVDLVYKNVPPFGNANGNAVITLPIKQDKLAQGVGVLAYLDIEALTDAADVALIFNKTNSSLIGYSGESLVLND